MGDNFYFEVKRGKLVRALEKLGFPVEEGRKHGLARCPTNGGKTTIPRPKAKRAPGSSGSITRHQAHTCSNSTRRPAPVEWDCCTHRGSIFCSWGGLWGAS